MKNKFSIKNLYIFYILYFIVIPFGFLTRVLYSHTISPTEFGFIYALYSFFGVLSLFTNLGFSSSLRYFIPKFQVKNEIEKIKNIFYYSLIFQQIIMWFFVILLYFFSKWIAINYFHNLDILLYFKFFILYFIFSNLFSFFADLLVSFQYTNIYQVIYFFNLASIFLFSFFVYFFKFNNLLVYYFLIIILVFFFTFLLYLFFVIKKFPYLLVKPKFNKKLFKEFFLYSISMFTSNLSIAILLQTDILVIVYFLSSEYVGYYSNATVLIDTMVTALSVLTYILLPYFSELKEKKDFETINLILNIVYNILFFIMLPFSLIFYLFPEQILSSLYGNEYILGSSVLMILSLFSIFKILVSYNLTFINSFGLASKLFKIIFPIALLNLILDIILVKSYGLNGVAYATVTGWVLITFFTFRLILKEIKTFKLNYKKYFKIFFVALLFVFLVIFLKNKIVFINYYLSSILILSIAFSFYFILGYLIKIYSIEELYIFIPESKLKKKFKNIHKNYFKFLE